MSDQPTLSRDQLERLEALCAERGAPVVERLHPGLSPAEMDTLTGPRGLRLPPEARTWWGWHDGAGPPDPVTSIQLGPMPLLPLASAIDATTAAREDLRAILGIDDIDEYWAPEWLCITARDGGDYIVVDCTPSQSTSRIHCVSFGSLEPHPDPAAASFSQLISMWITAIETGGWHFDPASGRWFLEHEQLPPTIRYSPLT